LIGTSTIPDKAQVIPDKAQVMQDAAMKPVSLRVADTCPLFAFLDRTVSFIHRNDLSW
jgi:hypothetical protein